MFVGVLCLVFVYCIVFGVFLLVLQSSLMEKRELVVILYLSS